MMSGAASTTSTRTPARASCSAMTRPTGPAPATTTPSMRSAEAHLPSACALQCLVEVQAEIVEHAERRRSPGAEHAAARVQEGADEIEPLDTGDLVLGELGGRTMRA